MGIFQILWRGIVIAVCVTLTWGICEIIALQFVNLTPVKSWNDVMFAALGAAWCALSLWGRPTLSSQDRQETAAAQSLPARKGDE